MKTVMAKAETVQRNWVLIDAKDRPLGRVATEAAYILRGKHKAIYTPHVDCGDYVVVINADKVVLTGNKLTDKKWFRHSGYPGGEKEVAYKDLMNGRADFVVEKAIKGMLPKNRLGRKMGMKVKVYAGDTHPHQAQNPQPITLKGVTR